MHVWIFKNSGYNLTFSFVTEIGLDSFDTHCTFIVLLSYLILVICISVPSTLCGREENIDEKYDPCILCLSPTGF